MIRRKDEGRLVYEARQLTNRGAGTAAAAVGGISSTGGTALVSAPPAQPGARPVCQTTTTLSAPAQVEPCHTLTHSQHHRISSIFLSHPASVDISPDSE